MGDFHLDFTGGQVCLACERGKENTVRRDLASNG